jgi:hypothetical protein
MWSGKHGRLFVLIVVVVFLQIVVTDSSALLQVAGPIVVKTRLGEAQSFNWVLLSNQEKVINVSISAFGNGSQYLSFPSTVELVHGKSFSIPVKILIPTNYSGTENLNPKLRATQVGIQSNGGSTVNVEVAKNVTIRILNFSSP